MMNTPVINMAGTGHNIRQLRKAAGITVSDLQKAFGFSTPQAIYKWQRGDALPTIVLDISTINPLILRSCI